jgi:hypothetical protein
VEKLDVRGKMCAKGFFIERKGSLSDFSLRANSSYENGVRAPTEIRIRATWLARGVLAVTTDQTPPYTHLTPNHHAPLD